MLLDAELYKYYVLCVLKYAIFKMRYVKDVLDMCHIMFFMGHICYVCHDMCSSLWEI